MRWPRYAIVLRAIKKARPFDIGTCRTPTYQGDQVIRHYVINPEYACQVVDGRYKVPAGRRPPQAADPPRAREDFRGCAAFPSRRGALGG